MAAISRDAAREEKCTHTESTQKVKVIGRSMRFLHTAASASHGGGAAGVCCDPS